MRPAPAEPHLDGGGGQIEQVGYLGYWQVLEVEQIQNGADRFGQSSRAPKSMFCWSVAKVKLAALGAGGSSTVNGTTRVRHDDIAVRWAMFKVVRRIQALRCSSEWQRGWRRWSVKKTS